MVTRVISSLGIIGVFLLNEVMNMNFVVINRSNNYVTININLNYNVYLKISIKCTFENNKHQ